MPRILATYKVACPPADIAAVAQALALEQSVEVPASVVRDRFVAQEVVAQVADVRSDGASHEVDLALATITTGNDVAQLFNMLFGNCSLLPNVELVDVDLPEDLAARMVGPRFGIAGVRALTGVHGRPLTCAALKPQGLPVEALAALCHVLASAGIDVIKDDHGLADQSYAPFAERVRACQAAVEDAAQSTGKRAVYAPSVVGGPRRVVACVDVARKANVAMLLIAPALLGLPAFAEIVAGDLGMPVLAHPAFGGATRIAPPLLLGRLFRLLGADAVIFPNAGGRFAYSAATCAAIAGNLRAPLHAMAPALPVPAGGMRVERVPEMVRTFGTDAMLLIGGSLLEDERRVGERARAFVDAVREAAAPVLHPGVPS